MLILALEYCKIGKVTELKDSVLQTQPGDDAIMDHCPKAPVYLMLLFILFFKSLQYAKH